MGEFADMMIDQMYDSHWDNYSDDPEERAISYKTCSKCKEEYLIWGGRDKGGWFLTDIKYNRHICKEPEPDPLDDINNRKVRIKNGQ